MDAVHCTAIGCLHHQHKLSHMDSFFWRSVGSIVCVFGGLWHEIVWEALHWTTMWACFSRPSTLRSCVESRAQNALLLVRLESAKVAALRPWRAHHLRLRRPRESNFTEREIKRLPSPRDSFSHGRIPNRNVVSGPAPCFPWEYTVYPVCCYHLSLCA